MQTMNAILVFNFLGLPYFIVGRPEREWRIWALQKGKWQKWFNLSRTMRRTRKSCVNWHLSAWLKGDWPILEKTKWYRTKKWVEESGHGRIKVDERSYRIDILGVFHGALDIDRYLPWRWLDQTNWLHLIAAPPVPIAYYIHPHVLNKVGRAVKSPADHFWLCLLFFSSQCLFIWKRLRISQPIPREVILQKQPPNSLFH